MATPISHATNESAPRGALSGDGLSLGPSLLASMWRHRFLLVVVTLLAGAVGYALSLLQPVAYSATGRIYLGDPTEQQVFETTQRFEMEAYTAQEAERLTSESVLERTIEDLEVNITTGRLAKRVSVEPTPETGVIDITATASRASTAAALANGVAQAYQEVVAESRLENAQDAVQQLVRSRTDLEARLSSIREELQANPDDLTLQAQLESITMQLSELETRSQELSVQAALTGSGVELYDEATVPESPSQPKPERNAALSAFLGLALASAYAWWNAGRNQKVLHRDDPSPVLDAPLLGVIPEYRRVADHPSAALTLTSVGPAAAEAYQFVAASIEFAMSEIGGQTVMITSSIPKEGKTSTALSVALAANRVDRSVMLVDADTRVRALSASLDAASHKGLADLANNEVSVDEAVTRLPSRVSPAAEPRLLRFAPAGRPLQDAAGFFRSAAYRRAMTKIRESADFILVDSPPLLAVADSSSMASQVDGVVVVVARGTPLSRLDEVRRRLDFVGAPVIGYVFNRETGRLAQSGYGYGYTPRSTRPRRRYGRRSAKSSAAASAERVTPEARRPDTVAAAVQATSTVTSNGRASRERRERDAS